MTTRRQLAGASLGLALAPFSAVAQAPGGAVALTAGEFFQEFIQIFDTTINFTHASEVSVSRFAQTALGTLSQILDRQNDIRAALDNVRYTVRAEIFNALYNEDVRNFMGDLSGATQVLPQIPVGSAEYREFMDEYVEKMDFHAAKIGTYGPEAFPVYILAAVAQLSAHRVNRSANHMLATYSQRHIDKLRSWITPHAPQSLSTRAFEIRQQLTAAQQALQTPARFIIGQGTQRQAWTREMIAEQRRADAYWRRVYGPQYQSQPLYQTLFNTTRYEMFFNGINTQGQPVVELADFPTGVYEASQLPVHLNAAFRTTDPLGRMMLWQNDNGYASRNQSVQAMIAACVAPLHDRVDYSEQRVSNIFQQIKSCMEQHYLQLNQSRTALEAELRPYNSTISAIETGVRRLNTLRTSLRLPVQNTPWHQLRYRPS